MHTVSLSKVFNARHYATAFSSWMNLQPRISSCNKYSLILMQTSYKLSFGVEFVHYSNKNSLLL